MKISSGFLTKNLIWKVVALAFAFVVWYVAVSVSDPIQNRQFTRPLQIRGASVLDEYNLVLLNINNLQGSTTILNLYARESTMIMQEDVVAFVDLRTLDLDEVTDKMTLSVPIQAEVANGENIDAPYVVRVSRPPVNLNFDVIESRTFDVVPKYVNELPQNLEIIREVVSPATKTLTGARSHLDNVHEVVLEVDLEGIETETNPQRRSMVKVLDEKGGDITQQFSMISLTANVELAFGQTKWVSVTRPNIVGEHNLPNNLTYQGVTIYPESIQISGDPTDLAGISSVTLPDIDIGSFTETTEVMIEVETLLPNALVQGSGVVMVRVELHSRAEETPPSVNTFAIPSSRLEIIGDKPNITVADTFSVTVRGINGTTAGQITGRIHVESLEIGTHQVPVELNVADSQLVSPVTVTVTVTEVEETSEAETAPEDIYAGANEEGEESE